MVTPTKFRTPPAPSTPENAPWEDAKGALDKLSLLDQDIRNLTSAINSLSAAAAALPPAAAPGAQAPVLATSPTPLSQIVEDAGSSFGGTATTLNDSTKYWAANVWAGALLLMSISGQLYIVAILSNTDQQLTFSPLPSGVMPKGGTTYAIKQIGMTSYQLQAAIGQFLTKAATKVLDVASLAASATSALANCAPINLTVAKTALALTVACTFNAAAVAGIKVHIRTSYDGLNYDTQDFDSWTPTFTAGAAIRVTKVYDTSVGFVKVLIENLDAGQAVTAITLQSMLRGPLP